jgi:transposase-like protein
MSIRDWCDRHGVSEPSFYFWRRELARRREQRQDSNPQIVPVELAPPVAGSRWGLEIELPSRIVLRVGPECNLDLLRQALTVLRDDGPEAEAC